MPYKDLDLPRLKTIPYPEADLLKRASGVNFDTPTLALATEGNRRVLRSSGIERLTTLEADMGRGGDLSGGYTCEYNFALIQPKLRRDVHQKTALHEASHALRAHFRDYTDPYTINSISQHARTDNDVRRHLGQKACEEGFAEYWEAEAYGTQILQLDTRGLSKLHFDSIEAKREHIRAVAGNPNAETDAMAYTLGHRYMLKVLTILESITSREEALRIIAQAQPEDVSEVVDAVKGKSAPKFLGLNWKQSLGYRARTEIFTFISGQPSQ